MTTLLDAPATTRKEKSMLKRQMAATAEPETTTATELPVGEPSTVVVSDASSPEQSAEVLTDTSVEAAEEPTAFPVTKPRTVGLPIVAFKPLEKDMSDDEVPYAPPMSVSPFFADDDDEFGPVDRSKVFIPETEEDLNLLEAQIDANFKAAKAAQEVEEKARKEKEAKDEAKRLARIEKRGSGRMLGNIMMAAGALGMVYGAVVTFAPGM